MEEECNTLIEIAEKKENVTEEGRFSQVEIRRFCVSMRVRSFLSRDMLNDALLLLLSDQMDELYTPAIASSLREGNTHTLKRNSVSDPIGSIQGLLKLLYSVRISYRFVMTRYMRSEKTSIKHTKLQISSFPPSHPQTVHNVS